MTDFETHEVIAIQMGVKSNERQEDEEKKY